ncbi:MAG: 3-hydroxybutyryl-CoA dehydrogenase; 3-hydroxyacyl-CoA dehydrogenase [uncultured Solirubrobacterales bacterium]|uniref:3-hydroxybutyryl-CoA dehydrogenase 3-hydroxyacyl-CoA dehydrogenase n=1 Tax=uncultured Solirubrobacterales bacterium TaxID=768556 RepID=A0A6J4S634_9ACTN|nr:MAG: 3-hydroxybutyryl-CoA dehydrogenase; 3-hydroxyacyl-CoA dehydrogenase [uncultured Solirubrobacterales bacterium]
MAKAAVVGAGTMGGEIAQTIAAAGFPVVLKDVEQRFVDQGLDKAREVTRGQFGRLVKKGRLSDDEAEGKIEETVGLIDGTTDYDAFGDVDFVIEAVPERIDLKRRVFAELDETTPGHAVLASNSSSLSIAEMGRATRRPEKVVGFHYFFPASIMRLIEVIEGEGTTSEDTLDAAANFAQSIRKQPIRCGEVPGFVVNRVLISAISEVWRVQDEEDIDPKEIDRVISESGAAPMGPFYLSDLLGLDTVLHVAEHLSQSDGGERFYVSPKMKELVASGHLGQKTGRGFYDHAR